MRKGMIALLMAAALTAQANDYNVVSYGAQADTTVLSTRAIQQAIDACSQAGGGRVVVPAGIYKTGTVVLKSNVHLFLEQGATL
jgi:polygalacturonase